MSFLTGDIVTERHGVLQAAHLVVLFPKKLSFIPHRHKGRVENIVTNPYKQWTVELVYANRR